ncbi:MAG: type II CAAX endopeptidase family protein [Verrucomicrobia bacterium]|nr:type II CAAX endopeptidase family protein [Verrucomicrobiota bacterium]MDA1064973.1 type II CAAX endopeptidase family protein [Verrucomicrobiota bacterium]
MKRDHFFQLHGLKENEFSAKGLWLIVYLYFGALVFAAIVAPLVFNLVHSLDPDASSYLAQKPFGKYFDRGRVLCLLILFPVLMKKANLLSWKRLGFLPPGRVHFKKWFAIGICMMALVYAVDFSFGILEPRENWSWGNQFEKIGSGIVSALLIAVVEESFFRGFVFRAFYTSLKPKLAVVLSSLFFAYVHFKMPYEVMAHIPVNEIGFDDGLFAIWGTLTTFLYFEGLLFLNLFLVGILLHLGFLYTRNLWTCVGLHAGWVVVIQSLVKTMDEVEGAHPFFGTERVADGYLVTLFLLGFIGVCIWLMKRRDSSSIGQ